MSWSQTAHLQPLAARKEASTIPQYREHALDHDQKDGAALQWHQQALSVTFPGIRESVRELRGKRMDRLALEFAATHTPKIRDELSRLSIERCKLAEPWEFVLR